MVDRINGGPLQGIWFSQDVRFASVTLTNGGDSFLTELGNSPTGNGDAAVVTSIDTQIELIADLSVATVTVESGFGPVAEGTPG